MSPAPEPKYLFDEATSGASITSDGTPRDWREPLVPTGTELTRVMVWGVVREKIREWVPRIVGEHPVLQAMRFIVGTYLGQRCEEASFVQARDDSEFAAAVVAIRNAKDDGGMNIQFVWRRDGNTSPANIVRCAANSILGGVKDPREFPNRSKGRLIGALLSAVSGKDVVLDWRGDAGWAVVIDGARTRFATTADFMMPTYDEIETWLWATAGDGQKELDRLGSELRAILDLQ